MEKRYTGFKPEAFQNVRTAVIDGDGFAWAIGWIFKEALTDKEVTDAVDNCIHDILRGVQAEHYIGVLSPAYIQAYIVNKGSDEEEPIYAVPNFRKAIAKSRPYKGNRPERPEWYLKWSPIIEQHLETTWGFVRTSEGYEADDLVATFMTELTSAGAKPICCGNDKDLLQIPGEHFNVVKKGMQNIDWDTAQYNLYTQVIMGDSTDGVPGLPKHGVKAAEKILTKLVGSPNRFAEKTFEAHLRCYEGKDPYTMDADKAIQSFYENYMLVKLRTDVPTDCFDIEQICCGYDLKYWNAQVDTSSSEFEQQEEIPVFDPDADPDADPDLIQFEQNHEEDDLEERKRNE